MGFFYKNALYKFTVVVIVYQTVKKFERDIHPRRTDGRTPHHSIGRV